MSNFYQTRGPSRSGPLPSWSRFDVHKIARVEPIGRCFSGARWTRSGEHLRWDVTFMRAMPLARHPRALAAEDEIGRANR